MRWRIAGMLMLISTINYLARSALGVAAPTLFADLHLTTQQYSWIVSSFQGAVMLQPLAGYALDVTGLKVGFALFVAAWSFVSIAHSFATGWRSLALLRGLIGLAEGCVSPAGMKAVAEWFPARERGIAGGMLNTGASIGAMLAPPLVVWAVVHSTWRSAFVVTGILGVVWALLWYRFYDSPSRHPRLTAGERDYIAGGQETHLAGDGSRPSALNIARRRNFWGIAIPRFLADPTWGTLTFWVPLYLTTVRHFDLGQIALFSWMPFLAADAGSLFGASVSSALQRRGMPLLDARRWTFTLGACLMTSVAFTGYVQSPYSAIALVCVGGFAHQILSVTAITMSSDLFKRNEVATVAGMAGTCANAGALLFNLLIGTLVTTVGYSPFFICLGGLDLLGAVVIWGLVREPPTPNSQPPAPHPPTTR